MAEKSKRSAVKTLDDAGIKGGSPTDRIIGMLLERTEAVRELHEAMRAEFRGMIDTHSEVKSMMVRLVERLEHHEKADFEAFGTIHGSFKDLGMKIDNLGIQILTATNATAIQKAQFNAGWRVLAVLGGLLFAAFAIFAIFFNHNWR